MKCQVYYPSKAKEIALNNEQPYHLVAWAKKGTSVVFGTNTVRCSAKFERTHPDGTKGYHLHAEMDLIRKFKPGDVSEINVVRFSKEGKLTMAKPCEYCQRYLKDYGIKKVRYTDWNGKWQTLKIK